MSIDCVLPLQPDDERYVHGKSCTFHGPIDRAAAARFDHIPKCPTCGGALIEYANEEAWWAAVRAHDPQYRNYETMLRWSEGRCFPDFDTLENAWRQSLSEATT